MKRVYKHIGRQDWATEGLVLEGSAEPIKLGDTVMIKTPDGTNMVFKASDGMGCADCYFFNEGSVPCPRITRLRRTMSDYKGHKIKAWTENCSKILCDGCYDGIRDELVFKSIDAMLEEL
jgi:hypothetical protein